MRSWSVELATVLFLVATIHGTLVEADDCGGLISNKTGTINSVDPGKGKNCTWYIFSEKQGATIMLYFDNLYLESETDTLTIYAGNKSDSAKVAAFTSHQGPETVVSLSVGVLIVFVRGSKDKFTSKFTMNYNTENCIRSSNGSQGILKSPMYLVNNGGFQCTYTISVPADVPVLFFPSLNLPAGSLQVVYKNSTVANLTGTAQPDDLVFGVSAKDVVLTLSIKNDSKTQDFVAKYQTANADCSGKIIADNSTALTNISLPSSTQFPVTCYWKFTVKDSTSHVYTVASVGQLTGSDSIQFYDGGSVYSNVIGGISQGVPWYVSSGQKLTVMAYLGSQASRTGMLQYKQDKFSALYMLDTTGTPITLNGKDVGGQSVSLQFLAKSATNQVRVDMAAATKLTSATVQIQDSRGNVLLTFGKDMQLFPVRVTDSRALVVIGNLTGDDVVSLTATALTSADCNQLYSGDTDLITASSSTTQNRTCTVAVTTGKATLLTINSLTLCKDQTVEVYAGLGKTAAKVATLSASYSMLSQIHFPDNAAPRLTWKDTINATGCGTPMLTASYSPQDTAGTCGKLDPAATTGSVQTPDFPNLYPLNFDCTWSFPSTNNTVLYMAFKSLELAEKHTVTVKDTQAVVYNKSTTTLPDDKLLANTNVSVTFSSAVSNGDKLENTARGLDVDYKILTCGGSFTNASAKISSPKVVNTSVECIWILQVVPKGKDQSVNVIHVNISLAGWVNSSSGSLSLYDGGSMREPAISMNMTGGNIGTYSRHNVLMIQYVYNVLKQDTVDPQAAAPFSFNLTYDTYNCNKSSQCQNGDCMLPGWRCDNVIQCPDGSDEIGCKNPPTSAAPKPVTAKPSKKGVAGYWIFLCLVIGLVLGIVVAIVIPKIVRRWRLRSYTGGPNNYGTLHEDA